MTIKADAETRRQLFVDLAKLGVPDLTAKEVFSLVTDPLAHFEFAMGKDGLVRVMTPQCVFHIDTKNLRVSVDAASTVKIHQARKTVAATARKSAANPPPPPVEEDDEDEDEQDSEPVVA